MEDAKRQTLARIVRAGAEEMLPRQLALLEQICAIDRCSPSWGPGQSG